jgi:hypothetical protein
MVDLVLLLVDGLLAAEGEGVLLLLMVEMV